MPHQKPQPGMPCVIELEGKPYQLRFTLRTLRDLQQIEKISILDGAAMRTVLQDPHMLGTLLYYGLKAKNPEITRDWIEDNVDASMLFDLAAPLAYATTGRWPDMEKILAGVTSPNQTSQDASATGSPSGQSDATTSGLPN